MKEFMLLMSVRVVVAFRLQVRLGPITIDMF